ncbi:MAG: hypothetical protein Fur0012_06740 [Elusimicrobiota bacterium]
MILLALKILLTVAIHLFLFSAYPDTGKYGDAYLWISITLWSCLWILLASRLTIAKKLLFPLTFLFNVAIYAVMIFFISLTMPQQDARPVLTKVLKGEFPDEDQLSRGKIKYLNSISFEKGNFKEGAAIRATKELIKKAKGEQE